MPECIEWEYARRDYRNYHNLINKLNEMGSAGWEAMQIEKHKTNDYDHYYHTVYFKRKKPT